MITRIADVLKPDELREIRDGVSASTFADGKATAGGYAKGVKNNQQLVRGMDGHEGFDRVIRDAVRGCEEFRRAVRPRIVLPILFNRYETGMSYGLHVDNPLMRVTKDSPSARSDVSFTLFLSDPDSYEGGELVIRWGDTQHDFKLPAGSLVAYPSSTLHQVAPVTKGIRLAAVGWVQSEVRDPWQRSMLHDLDCAQKLAFERDGKGELFDLVAVTYANLLRMWAE